MAQVDQKSQYTLAEITKRMVNGQLIELANTLEENNELLKDMQFFEANNVLSHISGERKSLPAGEFRRFNKGVGNSVSEGRQDEWPIAMLETYSEVDKKEAKLSGDPEAFREGEDKAITEGLTQTMADTLIYGNRNTAPEKINGLATRFNTLSLPNVWNGTGTGGTTTSVWAVMHGPAYFFGIYPKGSEAGLMVDDQGEQTLLDADGKKYQGYRTHFGWDFGYVVRDYRAVQRLANVQVDFSTLPDFEQLLIRLLNRMPNRGRGAVLYMNDDMLSIAESKAMSKSNVNYYPRNVFGEEVTTFRGRPIRAMDSILSTETAIS